MQNWYSKLHNRFHLVSFLVERRAGLEPALSGFAGQCLTSLATCAAAAAAAAVVIIYAEQILFPSRYVLWPSVKIGLHPGIVQVFALFVRIDVLPSLT